MFIVHAGGKEYEREEVLKCEAPQPTSTWNPIPHSAFLMKVEEALDRAGIRTTSTQYALSKADPAGFHHRFFFLSQTSDVVEDKGTMQISGRQSTDKSMSAALGIGFRVFVCDNLAFSADYVVRAKHTPGILSNLERNLDLGLGAYHDEVWATQATMETLQRISVTRRDTRNSLVEAARRKIITPGDILKVEDVFTGPKGADLHGGRTAWALMQSFTEHMKKYKILSLVQRSRVLNNLMRAQYAPNVAREYEERAAARRNANGQYVD